MTDPTGWWWWLESRGNLWDIVGQCAEPSWRLSSGLIWTTATSLPPNITANATKCSASGRVVGRMPTRRALNIIEASSTRRDYVVEANSPLSRTVVTLVDPRGRSKRDRTEEYILDWNSILTTHCF